MLAAQSTGMYVATGILFLSPVFLLLFAWKCALRTNGVLRLPTWRKHFVTAALLMAGVSTLVHIVWNISWLHSGGSPHGMGARPGLWQPLGLVLLWTFGVALVLSLFGKGKVRILLLGWAISMYVVFEFIYMLQFD